MRRALARKSGSVSKGLNAVCAHIVNKAIDNGDQAAAVFIAERVEGKAVQTIEANVTTHAVSLENADGLATTLSTSLGKRTEPADGSVH